MALVGISTFGTHPDDVADYLRPLLDHAVRIIPPSAVPSTPFYLLATAGMRLLPDGERDAVLTQACSFVRRNYRFSLPDCSKNIQVITGEEEGTFGWVAVNYLMDGFDTHDHASSTGSTYGFLDMGGASTQIAFEPNDVQRVKHADNLTALRLRLLDGTDVDHSVFVTTWLGYGTNQARDRYMKSLIDEEVSHHKVQPSASDPVIVKDSCLPTSLVLASGHSGYSVQGTGDFRDCMSRLSPLLNKNAPCLDEPCLFDGKHVPPIDFSVNHFIGISEYWYSTQDVWSLSGGVYDFVEFEKKAIEYCSREWEDIVHDHKEGQRWPSHVELSRLQTQCFKAAWIVNILHEGIGIPRIIDKDGKGDKLDHAGDAKQKALEKGLTASSAAPNFQSLNDVGDVAISWTLGKMVLEVAQSVPAGPGTTAGSEYSDGARGPHLPHQGIGSVVKNAVGRVDPMAFVGMAALVLFLWLFCGSGRVGRSILVNFFKPGGSAAGRDGGYVMANMEEGGASGYESGGSGRPAFSRNSTLGSVGRFKLWGSRIQNGLERMTSRSSRPTLPSFRSASRPGSPSRPWAMRRNATMPAYSSSNGGDRRTAATPAKGDGSPKLAVPNGGSSDAHALRSVRSAERLNGGAVLRPLSRQSTDRDRPRPPASFTSSRQPNGSPVIPPASMAMTNSSASDRVEAPELIIDPVAIAAAISPRPASAAAVAAGSSDPLFMTSSLASLSDAAAGRGKYAPGSASAGGSPAGSMVNLSQGYFGRRGVSASSRENSLGPDGDA